MGRAVALPRRPMTFDPASAPFRFTGGRSAAGSPRAATSPGSPVALNLPSPLARASGSKAPGSGVFVDRAQEGRDHQQRGVRGAVTDRVEEPVHCGPKARAERRCGITPSSVRSSSTTPWRSSSETGAMPCRSEIGMVLPWCVVSGNGGSGFGPVAQCVVEDLDASAQPHGGETPRTSRMSAGGEFAAQSHRSRAPAAPGVRWRCG